MEMPEISDYDIIKNELITLYKVIKKLRRENDRLKSDELTKMYNSSYWHQYKHHIAERVIDEIKKGITYTVIYGDINNLKITNDERGHEEANEGIAIIAEIYNQCIRARSENQERDERRRYPEEFDMIYPVESLENDTVIRFGGDEFIAILPGCNEKDADMVNDRIKRLVYEKETKGLSIAIGIADSTVLKDIPENPSAEEKYNLLQKLFRAAEKKMYEDKVKINKQLSYEEKLQILVDSIRRGLIKVGIDNADDPLMLQLLADALVMVQKGDQEQEKKTL